MRQRLVEWGPAVCSGVLLALAFPTFHWSALAWIALVPLLWRTEPFAAGRSAQHFFVAGFVFHVVLLQWLLSNIMWAGGWAVLGQVVLCAYLAAYWAGLGALWAWLRARGAVWGGPWTFALLWVAMEQLQARLFTGFGWSSLGYSQGNNLLALQWAALGTGLLVTWLLVFVNALVAKAVSARPRWPVYLGGAIAVVAIVHGVGYALLKPAPPREEPLTVGLFQSNFSLEMKWDPEYRLETVRNASEKSLALAAREDIDLMVWPEALILTAVDEPQVAETIRATVRRGDFALFAGAARWEGTLSFNSSYLFETDGEVIAHYDKMHLAPFGEYVPLGDLFPFISQVVPSIGDLAPGEAPNVISLNGTAFGPLICFEVLFEPMARELRAMGADFLVVVTNLAWFGHSSAIPQELEIARMRAVESRLPLVHAANTGISGVFDPYGRFRAVDMLANQGTRLYALRQDLPHEALIMRRLVGAFDLAAPAPSPLPILHRIVPWGSVVASAAVLIAAAIVSRRQSIKAG